ncbi:uncharacterized protein LOC120283429 [Dioscorea cayenensis subsp. rotundata]|uniref:Uncharacterized protein LOC120283429 n=1 Tax=Dioscorea cayennensis subsp. rotundata TaxID=55577 RepID=A0AB40D192_DIOCR|nr:uncharacterized protein LOC120283429 [Dioscorea cayenensis subsp. rotundata]
MCASSFPKREGFVYKRRKLQQNTVAILSEENTRENSYCPSIITFEEVHLTLRKDDVNKTTVTSAEGTARDLLAVISEDHHPREPTCAASIKINDRTPEAIPINTCSDKWDETHPTASTNASCRPKFEHHSAIQDACSSSKFITRHCSTFKRTEADDIRECSSTENMFMKASLEYTSSRDFCIFVLRSLGLLNGSCADVGSASSENLDVNGKSTLPCKKCGLQENPRKMLICDLCDEAVHISCNSSKVKKLPVDEWYCRSCMRKRPKPFLTSNSGKTSQRLNPISSMFVDNQPYVSGVRIGKDFQVEVPEWCGPTSIDNDYFNETSALDPTEDATVTGFASNKSSRYHSIGNWVQCQEVIYNGADDEGTICGKWRRAPLSVVQTDDWDCSFALPWDPIYADCAVPQELDTDVVHKHLKYIQMVRVRMANSKWKPKQTNK